MNPTTEFEGNPASGTLRVTAPPEDTDREIEVLVDCYASPGGTDEEAAATKTFTITGGTGTTTTTAPPSGQGRQADRGGRRQVQSPTPAKAVRAVPSFTG